jgi:hypothetical protein
VKNIFRNGLKDLLDENIAVEDMVYYNYSFKGR